MGANIPLGEDIIKKPLLYYKRNGNVFYFKNDILDFSMELKGKTLYDFVDQYDLLDFVHFDY